ncbi:nucleoside triphosphate pyrophosphatase [Prochlorococcus marinus]|uniref:Nucleoside triphosphate pyrophosphatase n=1 Tax=Prochlorococcus marinus XMU1408 TaxID=2213228 RepID=A0A318QYB2_PROMR|nr:nucleoside triphosphate pyrophosphatase [Prochlorococcus marinus]MBW3042376.1 septum formation protein Maf [Prochlorococcus marinus str. XMU1408]PYE01114.1 septum formation protein Maf [Prochlorococcus marinus XMU1408]
MFVLASASKGRQKLLNQIALTHKVIVSDFDETKVQESDPCIKVKLIAKGKGDSALKKLKKGNQPLNAFQALIACDSLFEFEGEIFGKPKNKEQLISRWQRMSGNFGFLHTGHYLISIDNLEIDIRSSSLNKSFDGVVTTKIEFMSLSNTEITKYASIPEPYNCAGGFAIEGIGGKFIKKIDGCFSNVIGLSLPWLKINSEKLGLSDLLIDN